VDVHISRLRNKLETGFAKPLLYTVRGKGYRLP
jgi:two-component system OmpR family response regulator